MGRRASVPTDERSRVVLEILRGEVTVVDAARSVGVSEATVRTWKRAFLTAGRRALMPSSATAATATSGPSEVRRLQQALEDTQLLLDAWRAEVEGLPPSLTSR